MTAFSHVALVTPSLDRARAFYTGGLGATAGAVYRGRGHRVSLLMEVADADFRGCFLNLGGTRLELLEYHGHRRGLLRDAAAPGFAHLSLVVPDLDLTIDRCVRHGGAVRQRVPLSFSSSGTTTIAFVTDPDHNRIELIAHEGDGEAAAHAAFLGLDPGSALGS